MTLFVDASALVAIAAQEPDYLELSIRVAQDGDPIWSAVSRWETIRALCRLRQFTPDSAGLALEEITKNGAFRMVPIGEYEAKLAWEAHRIYGKGNHRAQLNMGDCFAYACAKANDAVLLYKGDDFSRTDLA